MNITKIGHSCLLLEEGDAKILIDPGNYIFSEGWATPKDFALVDAIFITHEHRDHVEPEKLTEVMGGRTMPIYAPSAVSTLLAARGISSTPVTPGERLSVKNVTVEALDCPHGLLPDGIPTPPNDGFLFQGVFVHPGDCIKPNVPISAKVLALPVSAPWLTLRDALAFAKEVKPEIIFPIHDANLKYPDLVQSISAKVLQPAGIDFRALKPNGNFSF